MRDDDEADDDEVHADEWEDEDDDSEVLCPYCKLPIYEDAERCPHCERYISHEDSPSSAKPWWMLLAAAACLYVVFRWIFHW